LDYEKTPDIARFNERLEGILGASLLNSFTEVRFLQAVLVLGITTNVCAVRGEKP